MFFVLFFANSANSQTSPFVGNYKGNFTLKLPIIVAEPVDNGTWDITITSGGDIKGTHYSKTSGDKTDFEGKIDEKGQTTIYLGDKRNIIKGLLKKTEKQMSGSLGVICDFGRKKYICGEIEVKLNVFEKLITD